jgi:integrase
MPWPVVPAFVTQTLRSSGDYTVVAALLEFVILTACRSGEARAAAWSEIDVERAVWTVPADRMKAKIAHTVPLSRQVVSLLERLHTLDLHPTLVFPALRGGVLSDMALTALLRRVKAISTTPGRTATVHGFRSTFRDWCSEQGYQRDLAERALAHTIANKVEAAYHRTDLLEQRRPMMQAWADFVTLSQTTDVVVPLVRKLA